MSLLEKRLQILLDAERYERLVSEAARTRRSVGALVREAIDVRFPGDATDAGRSLIALLETAEQAEHEPGEGPAKLKAAYAAELERKLGAP